jgi:hypothetical protein
MTEMEPEDRVDPMAKVRVLIIYISVQQLALICLSIYYYINRCSLK